MSKHEYLTVEKAISNGLHKIKFVKVIFTNYRFADFFLIFELIYISLLNIHENECFYFSIR
jgi:hypothetical protein